MSEIKALEELREFRNTPDFGYWADEIIELADKIEAEITERFVELPQGWTGELLQKQPYTFDPCDVVGSLKTVGAYIDELTAERDEWKAKAEGYAEALEKLGCSVLANGTVFPPPTYNGADDH